MSAHACMVARNRNMSRNSKFPVEVSLSPFFPTGQSWLRPQKDPVEASQQQRNAEVETGYHLDLAGSRGGHVIK
jgi:hypothetical protein